MSAEDITFVFLIPAYNCKNEISQTLFSVFAQSYKKWEIIVIDDVSSDGTGEYVKELSRKLELEDKIQVVTRNEKYGEVRNTVTEVANIDDEKVVVRLDGGDWLTENDTLTMLHQVYKEFNPAVVWTQHRWSFTDHNISGQLKLVNGASVYDHPWVSSHLKTFRAKDLKHVPMGNFYDDEGSWIMIACDQAVFLPMMHLALRNQRNLVYFPRVCYHYNIDLKKPDLFTEDRSIQQKGSAIWIRERGYVE